MKTKNIFATLLVLALAFSITNIAFAEGTEPPAPDTSQRGTTLSADKTAAGYWEREFGWEIEKSVDPATWDLFRGDSGTSIYTIEVTKDGGTDSFFVRGEICVTNGGAYATEDLSIIDEIQSKSGGGQFEYLTSVSVDLGAYGVLAAGESHCYPYEITLTPEEGVLYRNVAHVTITNHAGWVPGGHNCEGPELCPFGPDPKEDFSFPSTPTLINDSINVDDTNGGSWGFGDSGSVSYERTFSCDGDEGFHENTATIRETGQSSSADVTVNCYGLTVTKDAHTSFDRSYDWSISKSGSESSLLLALNQSFVVNYSVVVDMTGATDNNWAVEGSIWINNPAPMDADLTNVSDLVSPDIAADVDCPSYTVPAEGQLVCTYSANLPNAATRTNTATATLQNYDYDSELKGTASGTTDFSGSASVSFASAAMNKIDECIDVTDTYAGDLGTVCFGVDTLPKTFTYSRTIGAYDVCGEYIVDNTAAFEANDTLATGEDSWNVNVNVPCATGCSLTIGYWKTHAGFGPQADMVTPLLPQFLGTNLLGVPIGKSINVDSAGEAVQFLSFRGSNNIFDASNGINKLYAQLLGVKLNIENGADGSAVSSTILSADLFLTANNSLNWSGLSKTNKAKVLTWMITLDGFNNGSIGPGHCSQ